MSVAENLKMGLAFTSMFFAGLILLIPHRIGMSRVNYVIKRYNLPISRAGLLLYKYHNNIELSLLIGTLFGNIIIWPILAKCKPKAGVQGANDTTEDWKEKGKYLLESV